MHPSPFIWALISKSLKTAPTAPKDSEIILSSDYSLMELLQKIKSDEWRNKIRRVVVLGGVPMYDYLHQQSEIPTRVFWTFINADCKADRLVKSLDKSKFKRISSESVNDMPILKGPQEEINQLSGEKVQYEVEVWTNYNSSAF